jgi:hypothetical protein
VFGQDKLPHLIDKLVSVEEKKGNLTSSVWALGFKKNDVLLTRISLKTDLGMK